MRIDTRLERCAISVQRIYSLPISGGCLLMRLKGGLAMCDTWVALNDSTTSQSVIFAKNSDRPIFDCQPLVFTPRTTWPRQATLQLEYVTLPQVDVTFATLGARPYWCWGYEEGINEYGVAIGNEAIYTRTFRAAARAHQAGQSPALGLLGMDVIRLALERSRSAAQAIEIMGKLIERFGGSPPTDAECRTILTRASDAAELVRSTADVQRALGILRDELGGEYRVALEQAPLDDAQRSALAALAPA